MEKINSPEIRSRLAQQFRKLRMMFILWLRRLGIRPTWCSWVLRKTLARRGLRSGQVSDESLADAVLLSPILYIVHIFKHRFWSHVAERIKTPSHTSGVTSKSHWCRALAALLPCYNDRNGCRPFKYQINSKLNFLAVQATLTITCN